MLITNPQDILEYGYFSNVFLYLGSLTDWKGLMEAFTQQRQCPLECLYISCPILQDVPDWSCPEARAFFQQGLAAQQTPRIVLYSICDFPISLLGHMKMELTIYSNVTFDTTTPVSPPIHQQPGCVSLPQRVRFYLTECTDWMGWAKMFEEDIWKEGRWQVSIVGMKDKKQHQQQQGLMVDCQQNNYGSQHSHTKNATSELLLLESILLNLDLESLELKNLTLVPMEFLRRLVKNTRSDACEKREGIERIHMHNVTVDDSFGSQDGSRCWSKEQGFLLDNNYWLEEWKATCDDNEAKMLLREEEEFVLQLNQQGKRRFLQQDWELIDIKDWVNAFEKSRDVSSVYYFLRMNPSICQEALL